MSQHDFNIANDTAPNVRADLNNALVALATQSSGSTEPSTTYAYMPWYDTSTGTLKIRNSSNTAWNAYLDHIEISKVGWQLYAGAYTNNSLSVATEDTNPRGVFFKSDGTKMYVVGDTNNTIYQYSLSSAWDLSTASYDTVSFSVNSQDTDPQDIFFKSDGTKMYISGNGNNSIFQYSLSVAWDLSTASYDTVSFSVNTEDPTPVGIFFKSDGTKMYVVGNTNNTIYQYSLTSAWNLATASYDTVSFSVNSQDTDPRGIFFKSDGTKMYVGGFQNDTVYQYSLSTAWDLSTASYDGVSFSVSAESATPLSFLFKSDGTKFYLTELSGSLYEYNIYILAG